MPQLNCCGIFLSEADFSTFLTFFVDFLFIFLQKMLCKLVKTVA